MTTSPTVSVRGQATIMAEPELATLTISIEAQGADRQTTMDLLSRRAKAVTDLVARFSAGIERSETSRLHVYPELDRKKSEKVRRYIGRTTTSLVVHDFAVLSDLVVGAGEIDLVSVDGPWWRLRATSDVYRQARLAAAADALERARDYAAAFGAELVGLVEIADEGMSHSDSGPMQAARALRAWPAAADGRGRVLRPRAGPAAGRRARSRPASCSPSPTCRPSYRPATP